MKESARRRASAMLSLASVLVAALPAVAWAQPVDSYGDPPAPTSTPAPVPAPTPTPTPAPGPGGDPELDLVVSQALVARARALDAEGSTPDARLLVLEALVRTPDDPDAKALLAELNRKLGIVDAVPQRLPIDPAPLPAEYEIPIEPPFEQPTDPTSYRRATGFVRYRGGLIGGAVAGGLFADVLTGLDGTSEDDVLGGAVIGAAAGGLTAYLLTKNAELTVGDHALIDSMAAWGLVGGLTFGLMLDPPEGEAYSLNGVLGIGGGYLIGHAAARKSDLSTKRMTRVNLAAFAGALAPWILYAMTEDPETNDDEQAFGFLSTVGLLSGAYLGFRWTRNMAPGTDPTLERDPAPTALFRRTQGGWTTGGIGLSRAKGSRGATLSLLSGSW